MISLFFRKSTSVVTDADWGSDHHKSISLDVEWAEANISEHLEETGVEVPIIHKVCLFIKEEKRLPNLTSTVAEYTGQEDLHPFWLIKRQAEDKRVNCELQHQIITLLILWYVKMLQQLD